MMSKVVAIVGAHQDTRELAPYDDPSVEIWAFNESPMLPWCKRVDVLFQPHLPTVYFNPKNRADEGYADWLRLPHEFPIYLIDVDPQVPASVRYPLDEIYAAFPLCEHRMFTSGATYALAFAAYSKVDKVLFYGIEATYYESYKQQREAIAYWVGFLQGHGIEVERHCADGIFVNPLYGRENVWYQDPLAYQERLNILRGDLKMAQREYDHAKLGTKEWKAAMAQLGVARGKLAECERYYQKIQAMLGIDGVAILDNTELERASKDYLPQIDALRTSASIALGAGNLSVFRSDYLEAAVLTGRLQENQDMLKERAR